MNSAKRKPLDQSAEVRSVYHDQHARIAADDRAMERFIGMFSTEYFGVEDDYFSGKRVLDAGCGNTAKLETALYRMGCREIHAFDLGTDFIPLARASLNRQGVPVESVHFKGGSLLDIPWPDDHFDFVACHGVIVHMPTKEDAARAMSELARVTKPGGMLYTVFGCCGGLLEDAIIPAARKYYRENAEFRAVIDHISPSHFQHLLTVSERGLREHEGANLRLDMFRELLDVDLAVLFQNILQCSVRENYDEPEIRGWYKDNGFLEPRRLKRYVKRKNIRRFFAPLHYETDSDPLLKVIYGSGNLEFVAEKL